jgi:hypothetical protein
MNSNQKMMNNEVVRVSLGRRGASLLLGAALMSSLAIAQDKGDDVWSKVGDLLAPKSTGYVQKFGVKDVRGQLRLYGNIGLDTAGDGDGKQLMEEGEQLKEGKKVDGLAKVSATGGLAGDVFFLGAMRELAAVEAKYEIGLGDALRGSFQGKLQKVVRVCGFTLRLEPAESTETRERSNAVASRAEANRLGPKELIPGGITATFMVGPVPMLIRANAGVIVDLGLAPFVETATVGGGRSVRFGLDGSVGAALNGWVAAGVGGGCRFGSVCAGVKADLRVLDATAGPRVGFGTRDGAIAQLRVSLQPAALSLLAIAYCEAGIGRFKIGRKFEYEIWKWEAPKFERTFGTDAN